MVYFVTSVDSQCTWLVVFPGQPKDQVGVTATGVCVESLPHDRTQDTLHYLVSSVDPKSTALPSVLGWLSPQANLKAKLGVTANGVCVESITVLRTLYTTCIQSS